MHINLSLLLWSAFYSFTALIGSDVYAETTPTDTTQCVKDKYSNQCTFIIRYENVFTYEKPDTNSKVLAWTMAWGDPVQIAWEQAGNAPSGWLPVSREGLKNKREYGWIEKKDIASVDAFRRVVGCWPIQHLESSFTDARFIIDFSSDGTAWFEMSEDFVPMSEGSEKNRIPSQVERIQSHVSFAPNVILIRDNGGYIVYGFNPANRRLYYSDESYAERKITYFPEDKLKGCEAGLKLENPSPRRAK